MLTNNNCPLRSYCANDSLCHCSKISGGALVCHFSLFLNEIETKRLSQLMHLPLFYLSIIRFINACTDLLIPVLVRISEERYVRNISYTYNASLPYFRGPHLSYAILAVTPLLVFVPNSFQASQRCLYISSISWINQLRTFMDSLLKSQKTGNMLGL